MPVAVTGREVHTAIRVWRVLAQRLLDAAHGLDEYAPVHRAQRAQAPDRVADRNLVCRLLLGFRLHQLFDRQARFGESLLDPGQRQRQGETVILEAAHELGDERAHHRRIRARHVGDHEYQALGIAFRDGRHLVRPALRLDRVQAGGRDPGADTAQVLDQRQPQHDRNRPELAQRELRDGLVGRDEARERARVDAAVTVGYRLERDVVHARQAAGRPLRQVRQAPAVLLG